LCGHLRVQPGGIAVWQNNGIPANQKIPHVHFHVAGTNPVGGTEFGNVTELPVSETDRIAERFRPFLPTTVGPISKGRLLLQASVMLVHRN